jgi:hypothetical protein
MQDFEFIKASCMTCIVGVVNLGLLHLLPVGAEIPKCSGTRACK